MSDIYFTPPDALAYIRALNEPTIIDPAMPVPMPFTPAEPPRSPFDAILTNPPFGR